MKPRRNDPLSRSVAAPRRLRRPRPAVVVFVALALLALASAVGSDARPIMDPCTYDHSCVTYPPRPGIAGGRTVRFVGGDAQFAFAASRIPEASPPQAQFEGHVRWADPAWEGAGLLLESEVVAWYGPIEGVARGREIWGHLRGAGRERLPFVLRAIDGGPPGAGRDTAALLVGDALPAADRAALLGTEEPLGFRYEAAGVQVAGDLQLLGGGDGGGGTPPAGNAGS